MTKPKDFAEWSPERQKAWREKQREADRRWLATPEAREKQRDAKRLRAATPEAREKHREMKRRWLATPEVMEKYREADRLRASKPEARERQRDAKRIRRRFDYFMARLAEDEAAGIVPDPEYEVVRNPT